ncbi:hypothetical protein CP8484711_0006B, partial [Chlamydia psittaci 84-8471/1]
ILNTPTLVEIYVYDFL